MHITSSVKQRSETLLGHSYEKVSKVDSRYLPTYLPTYDKHVKRQLRKRRQKLDQTVKEIDRKKEAAIICRRRTNRELGGGTD